ncbi:MAG TPA: hypothetical protein VGP73_14010 [Thermoanaerobaculia bacterium]
MVPRNRTELLERLGAKQRNIVWSWSAVDEAGRKVYFSAWRDLAKKRDGQQITYIIQEPDWGMETGTPSPARKEQDENLALAFDHGYETFAYFIDAKDPAATPRQIANTTTSFIKAVRLERQPDGTVLAYPTRRIEIR